MKVNKNKGNNAALKFSAEDFQGGKKVLLSGPLTVDTPAAAWAGFSLPGKGAGAKLIFDLADLSELDLNGSAQLLTAMKAAERSGFLVEIENKGKFSEIFDMAKKALEAKMASPPKSKGFFEDLGESVLSLKKDFVTIITFMGEMMVEFCRSLLHPKLIRWANVLSIAETAGVNSVPIVCLVSGLVGLIIAFQSAMLMKMFGMEIYVANLVGVVVVRELGPLIASIMLAGRSGSAFSAELGAMKAAEEVDAITTMGLSPVRELALPRVLASFLTTPLVTLMAILAGIMGGSLVLLFMGFSIKVYLLEATGQVSITSFLVGFGKSFVFGFSVGAIGCQRGLAAGNGPGAVGAATTSGVVANIVVIAVLDSMFAVLFYFLNI